MNEYAGRPGGTADGSSRYAAFATYLDPPDQAADLPTCGGLASCREILASHETGLNRRPIDAAFAEHIRKSAQRIREYHLRQKSGSDNDRPGKCDRSLRSHQE